MSWLWRGGAEPREIPQWAYTYLVTTLKVEPDHLSRLKCVEQVNFEGDIPVNLIRIFDPWALAENTGIKDFASLDRYPELILYEGYMEKESGRIRIARGIAD